MLLSFILYTFSNSFHEVANERSCLNHSTCSMNIIDQDYFMLPAAKFDEETLLVVQILRAVLKNEAIIR